MFKYFTKILFIFLSGVKISDLTGLLMDFIRAIQDGKLTKEEQDALIDRATKVLANLEGKKDKKPDNG